MLRAGPSPKAARAAAVAGITLTLLFPVTPAAQAAAGPAGGHTHHAIDMQIYGLYTRSYAVLPADLSKVDVLPDGWVNTPTGPLGPADRDLLVKVRLAGLWEIPAGDDANQRGDSAKVRDAGKKIAAEHRTLDEQTRVTAGNLQVALPDQPNADQKTWLGEMAAAQGGAFDQVFIDRLRAAHGKVFSVIAAVRAGTRNSTVRSFAATANAAVLRHMGYLESSGLVKFDELPEPPAPAAAGNAAANPGGVQRAGLEDEGVDPLVIWLVLIAAGVAAVATTARVIRSR